jgi:hypothetical protein
MSDKYIALSGYCKSKGLSIPKDFDINSMFEDIDPDDYKISGYKFKVSALEKRVPKFNFKKIASMKTEEKIIKLFRSRDRPDVGVIILDTKFGTKHKLIESELDTKLIEQVFHCDDSRVFDTFSFISSIGKDGDKLSEIKDAISINRLKFEIFFLSAEILSIIEQLSKRRKDEH